MNTQIEIINLEDLVPANHIYRKFTKLFTKLIELDKIANKHLTAMLAVAFCISFLIRGVVLALACSKLVSYSWGNDTP